VCAATGDAPTATEAQGGTSLDAAAATVAVLRAGLPFLSERESGDHVADDVKYAFLTPLVQLSGRSAYLAAMRHWRAEVPRKLGDNFKAREQGASRACCVCARHGRLPRRAPLRRSR
jgi:hypothetical protein